MHLVDEIVDQCRTDLAQAEGGKSIRAVGSFCISYALYIISYSAAK